MPRPVVIQRLKVLTIAAAILLPVGCAETELIAQTGKNMSRPADPGSPQSVENGQYKIGKPYRIGSVWYYPHEDFNYVETGTASWYGPNFHGKTTANGEVFDQNSLTAAHRTLPLPSLVRVTNLENGRSIVVRVNDRGPFAHNRILDMSRRGAQLLGFERKGTAEVKIEIMADESIALKNRLLGYDGPRYASSAPTQPIDRAPMPPVEPMPAPPQAQQPAPPQMAADPRFQAAPQPQARPQPQPSPNFSMIPSAQAAEPAPQMQQPQQQMVGMTGTIIQAASFSNLANAERSVKNLGALAPTKMTPVDVNGRTFYRVRVGPVTSSADVTRILDYLHTNGYPSAKVVKSP